jgi:hypothetical protein
MFTLNNDSKTLTLIGLILEGLLLGLGVVVALIFGVVFIQLSEETMVPEDVVAITILSIFFGLFFLIGVSIFIVNIVVFRKLKNPVPFETANKILTYQMVIGIVYLLSNTLVGILYLLSSIFAKRALDEQNLRK